MLNGSASNELLPDSVLIERARGGDKISFDEVIQRHFGRVYAVAYSRLGNRDSAEDLAQEVFLRAYLHLEQFQVSRSFAAWLCRIARNLAEDWRRQSQSASRLIPMVNMDQALIENIADAKKELLSERIDRERRTRHVNLVLETLPAGSREMVLLHYMEGMNTREISAITGVHRTTVRYHLGRALNHLRRELDRTFSDAHDFGRPRKAALSRTASIIEASSALTAAPRASLAKASALVGLTKAFANPLLPVFSAKSFSLLRDKIASLGDEIMKTAYKIAGGALFVALAASVIMPAIAKMKHASELQAQGQN